MRHYLTEEIPATTRQKLSKTTCDLCGNEAKHGCWESSTYEVNETEIEVTVRQREGTSFPDGGDCEEYSVDMCPSCFKNKLIPWLESQGCKAKTKEWEW